MVPGLLFPLARERYVQRIQAASLTDDTTRYCTSYCATSIWKSSNTWEKFGLLTMTS